MQTRAIPKNMSVRTTFSPTPRTLRIRGFSAIREADLTLNSLTILTGPQASGKSLVCKLTYFFQEFIDQSFSAVVDGQTIAAFEKSQAARFCEWFPQSAWGDKKFEVEYSVPDLSMSVTRASRRSKYGSDAVFSFDSKFSEVYEELRDAYASTKKGRSGDDELVFIRSQENWRFRQQFLKVISDRYAGSIASSQTYVPASRAFFTTMGKAMTAFEHGQFLDPITKSFGRLYGNLVDRMRHGFPLAYDFGRAGSPGAKYRNNKMANIFGGKPKLIKGDMAIEAPDGRVIPFNALSSGQQELLPLWLTLDYYETFLQYSEEVRGSRFLYIEEPEAHLFPEAQAGILDILSSLLRRREVRAQMVLTTHSPYILAKANNLLLAGKLGFRKRIDRQSRIDKIVPKSRWLLESNVSCYGLQDGLAIDLIGEDGLISTDYIDEVSQVVIDEFEKLLEAGA